MNISAMITDTKISPTGQQRIEAEFPKNEYEMKEQLTVRPPGTESRSSPCSFDTYP
jgi:hypothetical protein